MTLTLASLSQSRLNSKPVPSDLATLIVDYAGQLAELGVFISDDPRICPWADESYLTDKDWANPDIAASVLAMRDTNQRIRFVGFTDNGESFGLWCFSGSADLETAPPVSLDTEGQYRAYNSWVDCFRGIAAENPLFDEIRSATGNSYACEVTPEEYCEQRYQYHIQQSASQQ